MWKQKKGEKKRKEGVLKNFGKITVKFLCQSLFLLKLQDGNLQIFKNTYFVVCMRVRVVCLCVYICVCMCLYMCVLKFIYRVCLTGFICLDQLKCQGTDQRWCAWDISFLWQVPSSLLQNETPSHSYIETRGCNMTMKG